MSQRSGLFREEPLRYQSERRDWGHAAAPQPVAFSIIVWVILIAVTSAGIFLLFAQYSRRETVSGYLVPTAGIARIRANQPGTISAIHVKQGQFVDANQQLISLSTAQIADDNQDVNKAVLESLARSKSQVELEIAEEPARVASERRRIQAAIEGLQLELGEIDGQIANQRERIVNAEKPVVTGDKLKASGTISELEFTRREAALLEQRQLLAALTQQKVVRNNQITENRFNLEQLPIKALSRMRELVAEVSATEQKIAEVTGRQAYVLRAPVSGIVTTLRATVGENIAGRQTLMSIVPQHSQLQAELFAPARAIGFVRPGQRVRILYDAFPYQNFGTYEGEITLVSKSMLTAGEPIGPIELKEPAYRISVSLARQDVDAYGQSVPLQADMLLRADIILDRRSLLAWLIQSLSGEGARSLQ